MVPAQVLQRIHGELVMHISAFVRTDDAAEQLGRHDKPLRQIVKGANELVEYQKGRHVYKVILVGEARTGSGQDICEPSPPSRTKGH